jgi:hypothetical protein
MQSASRGQEGGLRRRVQALVDRYFGGSVNGAAKAWHVSQPTLKRICDGTTSNPRGDVLAKIASAHGTTVEWLLTGVGESDPLESTKPLWIPSPEYDAWNALVRSLPLSATADDALRQLPETLEVAFEVLLNDLPRSTSRRARDKVGSARTRAERLLLRAWTVWFGALADAFGRAALAATIEGNLPWLLLGYHPLAGSLMDTEAGQGAVDALAERLAAGHARRQQFVDDVLAALGSDVGIETRKRAIVLAHIAPMSGRTTTPEEIAREARKLGN